MSIFIRKHKILTALILLGALIVSTIGWGASSKLRGELAAKYDLAHGRYKELGFGLPVIWRDEYARLLHERYGIEFKAVAGCIVSPDLVAYVEGYNKVSSSAMTQKFHRDVLWETSQEAERNWAHRDRTRTPEQIAVDLFPYPPHPTRNIACFRSLSPGVSMRDVVQNCGRPDMDIGGVTYVFLYKMPEGGTVTIQTPYLDRIADVTFRDKLGKQATLVRSR